MSDEFKLPDIGEGLAEGEIVKWLVAVGDTVVEDQPLVEVPAVVRRRQAVAAALLAGLSADLDDGRLRAARARLTHLRALAGGRREVRAEQAALAWIEHRRDECAALLAVLLAACGENSTPQTPEAATVEAAEPTPIPTP